MLGTKHVDYPKPQRGGPTSSLSSTSFKCFFLIHCKMNVRTKKMILMEVASFIVKRVNKLFTIAIGIRTLLLPYDIIHVIIYNCIKFVHPQHIRESQVVISITEHVVPLYIYTSTTFKLYIYMYKWHIIYFI